MNDYMNIECSECRKILNVATPLGYLKLKEENEKLKAENEQLTGISGQLRAENAQLKAQNEEIFAAYKKWEDMACECINENKQLKAQLQNYTELDLLNKFRLGDRVAVHREGRDAFRGTIFNIVNGKLSVIEDGFYSAHDDSPFLPSQCRKLVKRRKRDKASRSEYCAHSGVELSKFKCEVCHDKGGFLSPKEPREGSVAIFTNCANCSPERKPHKCPACDGLGIRRIYDPIQGMYVIATPTCNTCNGTGIVWEPK